MFGSMRIAEILSRVRRHHRLRLGRNCIFRPPQTCHCLPLRVEIQAGLSVEIARTSPSHAALVAREAEHGQWHGNRDVDAQLAGGDVLLELGRRRPGASEDGGAVTVWIGIDQLDSVIEAWGIEADEDRTEDFFSIAFHVGLHIGEYGGSDLYEEVSH